MKIIKYDKASRFTDMVNIIENLIFIQQTSPIKLNLNQQKKMIFLAELVGIILGDGHSSYDTNKLLQIITLFRLNGCIFHPYVLNICIDQ